MIATAGTAGTITIAAILAVLAALDAAFAGFRASCGRTGLLFHRTADRVAARQGSLVAANLLTPVVLLLLLDVAWGRDRLPVYRQAGSALVLVYVPYAALVLIALAAYLTLDWRHRFLASAVLLGPLTLIRPWIACAGASYASLATRDGGVTVLSFGAVAALLAVEPLTGRRWYDERRGRRRE